MTLIKLINTDFYLRNLQNLRGFYSDNYQDWQKSSATDCTIKKIKMEVNLFNQWQKKFVKFVQSVAEKTISVNPYNPCHPRAKKSLVTDKN